jgi:drug/metabolite transporter (DMT)-like permease
VFWAVMLSRATLLVVLVGIALAIAAPLRAPLSRLPLLAVPGVLLFAGTLSYSAATREGDLSVVSVLGSLFPLVTVGLAFSGGERVSGQQAAGVTAALAGIVLVSVHV